MNPKNDPSATFSPRLSRPAIMAAVLAVLQLLFCLAPAGLRAQEVRIPNFWDLRSAPERPETLPTRTIRFLTDDDFPPLHFAGPDGVPTGFSVELGRAACEVLNLTCTVQVRRFDTLLDSLRTGAGDVVAAGIPTTAGLRQRFVTTKAYFRFPARFAARRSPAPAEPNPRALQGRKVAAVSGTAHEAYLRSFFPGAEVVPFPDLATAQGALRKGEAEYLFGDAMTVALWVGGAASGDCCALVGGPYLESRFFGEGIGFVLRPEDETLRRALEYALHKLYVDGKYAELYLKFFPVGPF